MNNRNLYETRVLVKNRKVYIVEAYGQLEVWSEHLNEPIGVASSRATFADEARAAGWEAS